MSILAEGQRVGSFVLVDQIGSTNMGEVWRAWDSAGQTVAVKTIALPVRQDEHFQARFQREAEEQRKLRHPSIVPIYDFFADGDGVFLVMPFIPGGSLEDLIAREGRLSIRRAIEISLQVLDALDYAHQHLVIHRDVKPSNILLDGDRAYLSDFGIALAIGKTRLTSNGRAIGTPEYMSPEQILNPLGIDHLTDVYGWGCVLYEMLAGTTPFPCGSGESGDYMVQYRQLHETAVPLRQVNPEVPARLERIVLTALEKSREDRFPGCGSFGKALESVLTEMSDGPVPAEVPQILPVPVLRKGVRKQYALAYIAAGLASISVPLWFQGTAYVRAGFLFGSALFAAVQLRLLYVAWRAIQDGKPRTTPGRAVTLLFAPLYNLYWASQVYPGWAADYNRVVASHQLRCTPQPVWFYWFFYMIHFLVVPALEIFGGGQRATTSYWLDAVVLVPAMIAIMCGAINRLEDARVGARQKQVLR